MFIVFVLLYVWVGGAYPLPLRLVSAGASPPPYNRVIFTNPMFIVVLLHLKVLVL